MIIDFYPPRAWGFSLSNRPISAAIPAALVSENSRTCAADAEREIYRYCHPWKLDSAPKSTAIQPADVSHYLSSHSVHQDPTELINRLGLDVAAKLHPQELIAAMDRLPSGRLTFAAEYLGMFADPSIAIPKLKELLKHERPIVREGAVVGLAHFATMPEVMEILHQVAKADPSPGVRLVAEDVTGIQS